MVWFYPTSTSNSNNRAVFYSYLDSTSKRPIWFTNDSTLYVRSTWEDSAVFGLPHGTKYNPDMGWRLSKGRSKRKIDACIAMVLMLDRITAPTPEDDDPEVSIINL